MAKKPEPKRTRRMAAAPSSEPGNNQSNVQSGHQIERLTDLDAQLAALAEMSLVQMRAHWRKACDKPVPRVRRTILRLALAYELQTALHGGLSRRTEQRLPGEPYPALRRHPDFLAFAERIGLVRAWEKYGWPKQCTKRGIRSDGRPKFGCK